MSNWRNPTERDLGPQKKPKKKIDLEDSTADIEVKSNIDTKISISAILLSISLLLNFYLMTKIASLNDQVNLKHNQSVTTNQDVAELNQNQVKEIEWQSKIGSLTTEIDNLGRQNRDLRSQLDLKAKESTELERKLKSAPVILIKDSDTDGQGRSLRFTTGQADLPEGLNAFIDKDLVDKLERIAKEYPEYQVIDVIGHTDGQATITKSTPSNLDTNLEDAAKGSNPINTLQAGSNTDLGLIRALAVVKKLQELQQAGRLKGLKFRAYSAGQLLLPDGSYANGSDRASNPSRRRIEIRFSPNSESRSLR